MSTHHQRSLNDAVPASLRNSIELVVRQQPVKARLCSFKEKVDRRPVDPPPIVQLICRDPDDQGSYLHDPYFFLYATLATADGQDLHFMNGTRTTAGSVVQSLHKLKDIDDKDGGFFIFADISVRHEGFFKLKFTLFKIIETHVYRLCSAFSDAFQVYSPKTFPGMSESTFLTRCFSDQGVRIRIRKETRTPNNQAKRRRTEDQQSEHDDRYRSPALQSDATHAMSMQNLLRSDATPAQRADPQPIPPPSSSSQQQLPPSSDYYHHHRFEPAPVTTTIYRPSLQLPPIQQPVPREPPIPSMLSTQPMAPGAATAATDPPLYHSSSGNSSSGSNMGVPSAWSPQSTTTTTTILDANRRQS